VSFRASIVAACVAICAVLMSPSSSSAYFRSNHFYSPSGNIECKALFDDQGRIFLACTTFNNRNVVYLYRYSQAFSDRDDGSWGFRRGGGPILAYNSYWSGFGFECDSYSTGMQCTNAKGHGFKIAREGISRF